MAEAGLSENDYIREAATLPDASAVWLDAQRLEGSMSEKLKVIIAGSREGVDFAHVAQAVEESGFVIGEVVCGGCQGADLHGRDWADAHGIPHKDFPVKKADWDRLGKAAGPLRNQQMAEYADALIAVRRDGVSKGTDDMIRRARQRDLPVYVLRVAA